MNSTIFLTLEAETCCKCGCVFGINDAVRARLLNNGETFYCTNGHGQHYTETEAQRHARAMAAKQAELDAKQRELTAAKCRLLTEQEERVKAERKCRRMTKRIHAGVCPCCNRTFSNLARHMQTKHPENVPSLSIAN